MAGLCALAAFEWIELLCWLLFHLWIMGCCGSQCSAKGRQAAASNTTMKAIQQSKKGLFVSGVCFSFLELNLILFHEMKWNDEIKWNGEGKSKQSAAPTSPKRGGKPTQLNLSFVGPLKRHQKERKELKWLGQSEVDLLGVIGGCKPQATSQQKRRACPSTPFHLFNQLSFLGGWAKERELRVMGRSPSAPANSIPSNLSIWFHWLSSALIDEIKEKTSNRIQQTNEGKKSEWSWSWLGWKHITNNPLFKEMKFL